MSAVTNPIPSLDRPASARGAGPAIPMATLVGVELRKMTDTRAGRWLLGGVAAVLVIVMAVAVIAGDAGTRSFTNLAQLAQLPMSILLPVLGVLAATSEWSQRTVLTTFSLVPSRGRVLTAKILASMALAVAALVVTLVVAAIAAALAPLAGAAESHWSLGLSDLGQMLVFEEFNMLLGVALGTVLLNSALAIVLYFVLPTVWSGLTDAISGLHGAQQWLDTGTTWVRLISDDAMTGKNWAQVLATAALWIAVPLTIGLARQLRREVD